MRPSRPALPLLVAWLAIGGPARAQTTAAGDVTAGGGYDSNIFLRVSPDPTRDATPVRGFYGQVAPSLSGAWIPGGVRLELSYSGDFRFAEEAGPLAYQEAQLGVGLPQWGPLRVSVAGSGGRFDATRYADEAFWLAAASAGARLDLGTAFRAVTNYRGELRRYPGLDAGWEALHAADLQIPWRPVSRFEVGPFATGLVIPDGGDMMGFRRGRAGLTSAFVVGPLTAQPMVWVGLTDLRGGDRFTQLGAQFEARVRLGRWLDLVLAGQISRTVSSSAGTTIELDRQYALLGLSAHAAHTPKVDPAPAADSLAPVPSRDGRVRFRFRARDAQKVQLIGSWDDWQTPTPLRRGEDASWEVSLALPPGSHRYRFMVDGEARRPPDAPRYVPDDFGGEDGALDVPAPGQKP